MPRRLRAPDADERALAARLARERCTRCDAPVVQAEVTKSFVYMNTGKADLDGRVLVSPPVYLCAECAQLLDQVFLNPRFERARAAAAAWLSEAGRPVVN